MTRPSAAGRWILPMAVAGVTALCGCRSGKRVEPAVIENQWFGPAAIAVAPALNLSGSAAFDPARVADLMASELSYAEGISVIPVSRVIAALAVMDADGVRSPAQALELTELLGADAILVFAVTEYEPYDPPSLGISAQLYGTRPRAGVGSLDAVALSRQTGLARARERQASPRGLLAQVQRVFDASHEYVVADIRKFAAQRNADESPYGWRRYVVSQQEFVRYCCHATIRALLSGRRTEAPGESGP